MTDWNEVDLLTCFEAEPEIGEDRLSFRYVTERAGYRLSFTLWPYDEDIYIVLHGPGQTKPLIDVWLHSCTEIRYVKEDAVESLSFRYRDRKTDEPFQSSCPRLVVRPEFSLGVTR